VKRYLRFLAVFAALALVLAACGDDEADETTTTETADDATTTSEAMDETTTSEAMDETTTTGEPMGDAIVTCLVTDLAGVDDRSFNASAWQGVLDAVDAGFAAEDPILLESDDEADYQPNIDQCIAQGAQHIVTVGFQLGDATATNAEANPDINWTIVDFAYDPDIPNVRELVYQTDEAAFAAGYLAAGMTESGIIGTYGGLNIPTVSIFMDGLARGVEHYNEVNGADVQVIGWNIEQQDGAFTGGFDPADPVVRATCESQLDEGADNILPVGGAINQPCGTAIQDRGIDAALIGVDQDAFLAAPEVYQPLWLTTIEKGIAIQVTRSIEDHFNDEWSAGGEVGNLANDGVGLSPYHAFEEEVPAELDAEVQQLLDDIASGEIEAAVFPVG
jgi:basic membrane protein A